VVNELRTEKVDVVQWREDPAQLIAEALGPAKVREVRIDEEARAAVVVVSDHQLSLAIGREGQNARLAARLTGYRVDIRSETEEAGGTVRIATEVAEPVVEPPAEIAEPVAEPAADAAEMVEPAEVPAPEIAEPVADGPTTGTTEEDLAEETAADAEPEVAAAEAAVEE
jgi:N utilization substance protein A